MSIDHIPVRNGTPQAAHAAWPAWLREIENTLSVHSQYILHGNIRDQYVVRSEEYLSSMPSLLWQALRGQGYACLIAYDPVDGLQVLPARGPGADAARSTAQRLLPGLSAKDLSLDQLRKTITAVATAPNDRVGLVIDYAARLTRSPIDPTDDERKFFLACAKLAATATPPPGVALAGRLYNPVIWLVDSERDLPPWLTAGNVQIRTVGIPHPSLGDRMHAADLLTRDLQRTATDGRPPQEVVETFAVESGGMSLKAMAGVTRLAKERGIAFERLPEAVQTYRLGVVENPWRQDTLRRRIAEHQGLLEGRVKGQPAAVDKTLDILKRAAMGLSGAQTGRSTSRPRGVLFFAGPTGVGKTELAKSVAQLLFGDESACLRFDMSEYAAEHAADRLIGAPPGYVGYEAGGQLTNALRQQPFRVILFDEIEKAHPSVLDKFLQILEDGRLTDGQGTTTYFSESVLIFTSNLGILRKDKRTGEVVQLIDPGTDYHRVVETVNAAIKHHFTYELVRPELLNRLGDNIVVFDFISRTTAERIFRLQLSHVLRRLREEHHVDIELSPEMDRHLLARCTTNLNDGGRGIGNKVESQIVNPLGRLLFDQPQPPGSRLLLTGVNAGDFRLERRR
ncbi:AAA family ATPase [Actinoplanes sichuanensis]|uniref:AAA family ATPase n=1 Tax=Actinoplanes sichuanensis TaxID=512349 RepID=A0ABW4A906_9ACTN|nr:AAA family ATPase [Actinoplanes sichuanensis]BEL06359.1 AAA family ATPase [Actinoplanes sichuanensis]